MPLTILTILEAMSDRDNNPFSIPSILAIKKANEIKDGKGPLLFSSAKLPHRDGEGAKDTVVVGSGELPTSSVVGETVGEPPNCQEIAVGGASPYHPHAIIANGQQVGLLQWVDLDRIRGKIRIMCKKYTYIMVKGWARSQVRSILIYYGEGLG